MVLFERLSLLSDTTVADMIDDGVVDASTGQGLAFEWLLNDDGDGDGREVCPRGDAIEVESRFALAALYFATTGGGTEASWTKCGAGDGACGASRPLGDPNPDLVDAGKRNFLAAEADVCDWAGITCADDSSISAQVVTKLELPNNGLSGTILAELGGALSGVEELVLRDNDLVGTIPTALGQMTRLRSADFRGNDLSGSVPDEVCALRAARADAFVLLAVDCDDVDCECCEPPCSQARGVPVDGN